jgi:hypothetical protein
MYPLTLHRLTAFFRPQGDNGKKKTVDPKTSKNTINPYPANVEYRVSS